MEKIPLWDDEIPNSQKLNNYDKILSVFSSQKPSLEVYIPQKGVVSDKSVIICPGGGYVNLSYDWEGVEIAQWLNSKGITAFVLNYRLPNSKFVKVSYEAPMQDLQRAVRIVRSQSKERGLNPNKIGVIGFSAGGHLASTLGTQFDKENTFNEEPLDTISARPDFMALIYPVVTMQDDYTHKGSMRSLLGKNPSKVLKIKYSNELQVTKHTPPTFLVHSKDDKIVPIENSLNFYNALKDCGIKVEKHIYSYGGHGYGLAVDKGYLNTWTDRFYEWLLNQ